MNDEPAVDDYASDKDLEYEDTPNNVAFPADEDAQKVFAAP